MLRKLAIPVVLICLWTTACQTSMVKQFENIKPGMEKDDVLNLMGSPNRTQRFHGKDRWTYVFYDQRIRFEKEIQFLEGNAIYVGDVWQPEPENSAVAIDKRNDEKNLLLDSQMIKDIQKYRNSFDEYESRSRGQDKVRYLPKFEPIQ